MSKIAKKISLDGVSGGLSLRRIKDYEVIKMIKRAKIEFHKYGAAYTFVTYRTMNNKKIHHRQHHEGCARVEYNIVDRRSRLFYKI